MSCDCQYYEMDTFQTDGIVSELVTYVDDDGVPINLTSATISFYARLNQSDTSNLFELHVGSGITITNGAAGQFTISATGSTMSLSSVAFDQDTDTRKSIPYWIVVTPSGLPARTIMYGPLIVRRS